MNKEKSRIKEVLLVRFGIHPKQSEAVLAALFELKLIEPNRAKQFCAVCDFYKQYGRNGIKKTDLIQQVGLDWDISERMVWRLTGEDRGRFG